MNADEQARSISAACEHILARIGVRTGLLTASIGRIKNLLRAGLLPGRDTSKGRAVPLSAADMRRLTWATLLTTCDIPPATVARAINSASDEFLARDLLVLELKSSFHGLTVQVMARWPAQAMSAGTAETEGLRAQPASAVPQGCAQPQPESTHD